MTLEFEHGHWWLLSGDSIYDVIDQEGGNAVDGFGLEQVS